MDQSRIFKLLKKKFTKQPTQKDEITRQLERERGLRVQLMRIGVPAQLSFFAVGLAYPDSKYMLIEFIPLVLLIRWFALQSLRVARNSDGREENFLDAAARVPRRIRNGVTADRIRVMSRTRYRGVRWPFSVLILEQRWKATNGQFFLVIAPDFHWWSGGSIWFPWHWNSGRNAELQFSRSTTGRPDRAFCIKLSFPGSREWNLRFKDENDRERAYQALASIRGGNRPPEKSSRKSAEPDEPNRKFDYEKARVDTRSPEKAIEQKRWHDVLRVSPEASSEEITAAYRDAIKKCHPDKVANLSELIKKAAEDEAVRINKAYEEARSSRGF